MKTSKGEIVVNGRLSAKPERPILFVIRGLYAPKDYLNWLVDEFADEADVLLAHLPGMHSHQLVANDLETITAAFQELLTDSLPGRLVIPFGVSGGALVAAQLKVETAILMDPFLNVADCWALHNLLNGIIPNDKSRAWCEDLIGQGFSADLRHLAAKAPPQTTVLVGQMALHPRRYIRKLPSLASAEERAMWKRQGARVVVCPGAGHTIAEDARPLMVATLRDVLARTAAGR